MSREDEIRRLVYQSCHRGCKETDMMLGRFAQKYVEEFSDEELKLYEYFINEDDWNIYAWLVGSLPFPEEHDNRVTRLLRDFDFSKEGDV